MNEHYEIIISFENDEFVALMDIKKQVNEYILKGYIPVGPIQKGLEIYYQSVYLPKTKEVIRR